MIKVQHTIREEFGWALPIFETIQLTGQKSLNEKNTNRPV
jgi:hypothetical protein